MTAPDKRFKDSNWIIPSSLSGKISFDSAQLAVLMDIRDELKQINSRLDCWRVSQMMTDEDRPPRR